MVGPSTEPDSPADLPPDAVVVRGGLMSHETTVKAAEAAFREIGVYGLSVWSLAEGDAADIVETARGHDEATGYPNLPHRQVRCSTVGSLESKGFGLVPDSPLGHYLLTLPEPPAEQDWAALQEEFGPPEPIPSRQEA